MTVDQVEVDEGAYYRHRITRDAFRVVMVLDAGICLDVGHKWLWLTRESFWAWYRHASMRDD